MSGIFPSRFYLKGLDGKIMGVVIADALWQIKAGQYLLELITPENGSDIKDEGKSRVSHLLQ